MPLFDENDFTYNAADHAYARTDSYVFAQIIPYIGSKRKLLPLVLHAIERTGVRPGATFADLFAGSGVVSRMAKAMGYRVVANDWEPYAEVINGAFIGLNTPPMPESVFDELNELCPVAGFITQNYCPGDDENPQVDRERLYYTHANGQRIDAIRSHIAAWEESGAITLEQQRYLLAPLLSASCYVSNTSGVFKAYHAGWGGKTATALYRILSPLKLSPPPLIDNGFENVVTRLDAMKLASSLDAITASSCDIAYLDPPYNQHPYGSNYHLLNTIALYDKPEVPDIHVGKSAIRTDWRSLRRSAFNCTATALPALLDIVDALPCRWVLLSYSTDGNIPISELTKSLADRGRLWVETHRYKRYRVSAQRMSAQSHNVEFVLILDRDAKPDQKACRACRRLIDAAARKHG
ncbi:MAG: DNA adenine methylase [Capsulimonadaceae bacterium]|nr:DNA adenine methylase [Capsulimonadaceae bacterium]